MLQVYNPLVSLHTYVPRTFPTIFNAAISVLLYKNFSIAHSFVDAEHTFLPVQCVTVAVVCFVVIASSKEFQCLLCFLSAVNPLGFRPILIFSRFIGFLFLMIGAIVSFFPKLSDEQYAALLPVFGSCPKLNLDNPLIIFVLFCFWCLSVRRKFTFAFFVCLFSALSNYQYQHSHSWFWTEKSVFRCVKYLTLVEF